MTYPRDLKYTKDHEWISVDGDRGQVGITDYAQQQLGDVVYIELPEVGRLLRQGEQFGSIESVKAVSDLYAPISGEVVGVNEVLSQSPETVNESANNTWMITVKISQPNELAELLNNDDYAEFIG